MDRSRTPSAKTLAMGSLLAGSFMLCVVGVSTSTTGCSSVETTPAPDAAPPPCERGPFLFACDPPAAGQPSCNTSQGASEYLARLPQSTAYPIGCVVNFVGPRDEQGDCSLEAVCKCIIGELPGTPPATPDSGTPADGGDSSDAGTDAEAGAPPPPPPLDRPTTGPVWLCE